ncbi:MAG: hypothetical protein HQL74_05865 [Magnetococcales bacterium]|nr:hypothetical protein [Magnetococcales bacterium]
MIGDCFQILAAWHPGFVETFRDLQHVHVSEVVARLRMQFFVAEFFPAGLRDRDVVLWLDPNGKVHLSVYGGSRFTIIGKDGDQKIIHLRARWQRTGLRPAYIVREKTP